MQWADVPVMDINELFTMLFVGCRTSEFLSSNKDYTHIENEETKTKLNVSLDMPSKTFSTSILLAKLYVHH